MIPSSTITAFTTEYQQLEAQMADPAIIADQPAMTRIARRHRLLKRILDTAAALKNAEQHLAEAKEMLAGDDAEMRTLAESEITEGTANIERLSGELEELLAPRDPIDGSDVILEIRAGAGGDEAALFAADLLRMHTRHAETRGWKLTVLSENSTGLGGFKEVIAEITGEEVYGHLRFESGTHRVQRVPKTENQGRIHTSTVTVAVLPVEDDTIDIEICDDDIKIDVFRASGAGGQHVNVTDSAVRVTHFPTGIVISCQDERSQHQNRAKAMRILSARLLDAERQRRADARAAERRGQVGSGDRSEKIRTYNFPQSRLTDHRIGLTLHSLPQIMEGQLGDVLTALKKAARAKQTGTT